MVIYEKKGGDMEKIKRRKLNWSGILWDLLLGIVGGVAVLAIGTMIYLMFGGRL